MGVWALSLGDSKVRGGTLGTAWKRECPGGTGWSRALTQYYSSTHHSHPRKTVPFSNVCLGTVQP